MIFTVTCSKNSFSTKCKLTCETSMQEDERSMTSLTKYSKTTICLCYIELDTNFPYRWQATNIERDELLFPSLTTITGYINSYCNTS